MSLRKLTLPYSLAEFVTRDVVGIGVSILPLRSEHTFEIERSPFHHRDPFDRILVAQSMAEGLTRLSKDALMKSYPIPVVWGEDLFLSPFTRPSRGIHRFPRG